MNLVLLVLSLFGLGSSVIFSALNWLAWRRCVRLNILLERICTEAFLSRHMPIWTSWSEMTGIRFEITPRRPRQAS